MLKSKMRVLIADGNEARTRPVRYALSRDGHEVVWAPTPVDLLVEAGRLHPALTVISEDLAPDIEVLLGRVRHRSPQTTLILLCAPEGAKSIPSVVSLPRPEDPVILYDVIDLYLVGQRRYAAAQAPIVLCVDDDRRFLDSLTRVLTRHGYNVTAFTDADPTLQIGQTYFYKVQAEAAGRRGAPSPPAAATDRRFPVATRGRA